ncbi:unnamed protein product [Phaeothamnion confervicola]
MQVGAYVDGFNLYYALKRMQWRHLYWLDLEALCESLKPSGSSLAFVNYYTSRSKETARNRGISNRQQLYWRALRTRPKINLIEGKILPRSSQCEATCKEGFSRYQEKETDVKLGIDIVRDALKGRVQGIILITADTDQVPTLRLLQEETPNVNRRLCLPPSTQKFPMELTNLAHKPFTGLTEAHLSPYVFDSRVKDASGKFIDKPLKWQRSK